MGVFATMKKGDHEQVVLVSDKTAGLRAIIAIHNTTLGPAIGGIRVYDYRNEETALAETLEIAQYISWKASIIGMNFGGGHVTVMGDPAKVKNELLLRALGRHIHNLGGRIWVGEDMGIATDDMSMIRSETEFVTCLPFAHGGGGDTGPPAAEGVLHCMVWACGKVFGTTALKDRVVYVQGAGHVGHYLVERLVQEGARVLVDDHHPEVVAALKQRLPSIKAGKPADLATGKVDIYAPCGMGRVIDETLAGKLKVRIIAGSANAQLTSPALAAKLEKAGILHVPDFVASSGAMINVASELEGYDPERVTRDIAKLPIILDRITDRARDKKLTLFQAAVDMATERLEKMRASIRRN